MSPEERKEKAQFIIENDPSLKEGFEKSKTVIPGAFKSRGFGPQYTEFFMNHFVFSLFTEVLVDNLLEWYDDEMLEFACETVQHPVAKKILKVQGEIMHHRMQAGGVVGKQVDEAWASMGRSFFE
jgi:hypothetical protein